MFMTQHSVLSPQSSALRSRGRRGFTLVESMMAVLIFSLVSVALMGLFLMSIRFFASISSQTRSLSYAKSAMEGPHGLNREIRKAVAPLKPVTPGADGWFNAVEFNYFGEAQLRRIELRPGADNDLNTPWDNELVYQSTSGDSSDEAVIARWLAPVQNAAGVRNSGIFSYTDATRNLIVRARVGDPVGDTAPHITGPGLQGAEINITVSPRN
jgi:prepilin-type N-terminal cleavage/methylation domain-containing protein